MSLHLPPPDGIPPSILFCIRSLALGGAEKQLSLLIHGLQKRGLRCALFVLETKGVLEASLARAMGRPPVKAGLCRGDLNRHPWTLFPALGLLIRTIRTCRPSVVHAFLPLVTCMGALSGRLCGVPFVVTSRRALGTHQDRYPLLKPMDLLASRLSHRITVNSEAVRRDLLERDAVDPRKVVLIYNAVEIEAFRRDLGERGKAREELGIAPDHRAVVMVANFIPYKGHSDFLEAAARILTRFPEARFLLVGEDRGLMKTLIAQARGLGILDWVRFLGQRTDIPRLMAASDLSVLCSHEEGFSNVILESMAAGLPVVATRVGGNPEAVEEGATGWLVPPRDPAALAVRILDLLKDPSRAEAWGRAGQERVRRLFSVDRMLDAHLALYGLSGFGGPTGRDSREEVAGSLPPAPGAVPFPTG